MNILTKKEPLAPTQTAQRRKVVPRYDVRRTEDAYLVTAYVPEVESGSVETTVDGEKLTVSGRRTWTAPEGWTPIRREIRDVDYLLTFELDDRVNREAIRAELKQGVLTLTIPKAEAVKARKIEIQG